MSDLTPLERLDDAIREYSKSLGLEGDLSAWVLGFQMTKITDDARFLPLTHAEGTALGASTSRATALGLLHLSKLELTPPEDE